MTDKQQILLLAKGTIANLPEEQRQACEGLAERMRLWIKESGKPVGYLAIALVGAEINAGEFE